MMYVGHLGMMKSICLLIHLLGCLSIVTIAKSIKEDKLKADTYRETKKGNCLILIYP